MLPFKKAIELWEQPLGEKMISYSALTRKAQMCPDKVFVIVYWNPDKEANDYKGFDVGLKKITNKWMVDTDLFAKALRAKIKSTEDDNKIGKTKINISYPKWLERKEEK